MALPPALASEMVESIVPMEPSSSSHVEPPTTDQTSLSSLSGSSRASSTTNLTTPLSEEPQQQSGLQIIIVGAGIGGLSAALALRHVPNSQHRITLLEQSRFASEHGAAIHLAPNANGLLKRLGVKAEEKGAVEMERMSQLFPDGREVHIDLREILKQWQNPWLLGHRVHLHSQLKEHALDPNGPGIVPELRKSSKVSRVDAETGRVYLVNGEVLQGDVIVGADGVHSATRSAVPGGDVKPFCDGKSAFRFLISRKTALDDPVTAPLVQEMGEFKLWYGVDRRVVMYPTFNNELLNFVCIHPAEESAATESEEKKDWGQKGNIETMLDVYQGFDPAVLALLKKADPITLKVWELLDMPVIPQWSFGKLTLIGDAAHPFLPHQGQGGACAIEDAASLSVMLPTDTKPDEVPERLKLYEKTRMTRANILQQYTRDAGADLVEGQQHDIAARLNYFFGHDEFDHSDQVFRKYLWEKKSGSVWRSPLAFGPLENEIPSLIPSEPGKDSLLAHIAFKTSRTRLQNLFPNQSLRYSSPATVVPAYYSFSRFQIDGTYRHSLKLFAQNVQYKVGLDDGIAGDYLVVWFTDDPTLEQHTGLPIVHSNFKVFQFKKRLSIQLVSNGFSWGELKFDGLQVGQTNATDNQEKGRVFIHKCPAPIDDPNGQVLVGSMADFDSNAIVAHGFSGSVLSTSCVGIDFDGLDWQRLPDLHHIVSRLEELPIFSILKGEICRA